MNIPSRLRHATPIALALWACSAFAQVSPATAYGGADEAATAIKLTKLGSLTFSFYDPSVPVNFPREAGEISYAMTEALNNYNTIASYSGNVPVTYVTWGGVTAQANFGGSIQFGYMRSPRTAQHEMSHWMGSQNYAWGSKGTWGGLCNGGWQGAIGQARMKSFVPGAGIGCSWGNGHFWDYGLNQDSEYHWLSMGRNVAMVGAMRADFGLSDGSTLPDRKYRLVNRLSGLPIADKSQVELGDVIQAQSTVSTKQVWVVSFQGGYIRLKNLNSQRYLDGSAQAPVLRATPATEAGTWWEMTPTTEGYFRLRNKQSNLCLKSLDKNATGAALKLADCEGFWNPNAGLQFSLALPPQPVGMPVVGTVVQLASTNYPALRIQSTNERAVLGTFGQAPTVGALMQAGAVYYVRPGLADDQCISLESYTTPNAYMRHAGFVGRVNVNDGSDLFKADATFCPMPGVTDAKAVTLRSYNYPDRAIRHAYFQTFLTPFGADPNFGADATFVITPVWSVIAGPSGPSGRLRGAQSGRCVDAPVPAAGAAYKQTVVWDCNGNAVQKWALTSAMELRNDHDGKCLSAMGGATAAGTPMITWACNGAQDQKWKVRADGSVVGLQSGLCVSASGQTGNGSGLSLQACSGNADQKWAFE